MFSPGESLSKILKYRKISLQDFAKANGISLNKLRNIINDTEQLDLEMCQILEMALGFRASYWMSLQQSWNYEKNK